jgi:hypothetical protein
MEDSINPISENEKNESEVSEMSINSSVVDNRRIENPLSTASTKSCGCGGMGNNNSERIMADASYVYAVGKIVYRFPNKSIELELAQAIGRRPEEDTKGRTSEEVIYTALTDRNNRYIARQICYLLTIEGLETYILVPSDPLDVERLVEALRPNPGQQDIDVIIGIKGPMAPPQMCNGLVVPIVSVDNIYSFDRDTLMKAIPKRKEKSNEDQFRKTADVLFNHIIQIADNSGAIDEHRALNYLAVRYDEIYHRTQLLQDENYSLTAIEVRPSRLSGTEKIVDVVFSYENRTNRATQKWFCRVSVTGKYPFLVSPMQEYFER